VYIITIIIKIRYLSILSFDLTAFKTYNIDNFLLNIKYVSTSDFEVNKVAVKDGRGLLPVMIL